LLLVFLHSYEYFTGSVATSSGRGGIFKHEFSGVVSGTTVRALVLGRFSQKKLKIELKDNAKNE